jgi:hypothetical protein
MLLRDAYWLAKEGKIDSAKNVLAEILELDPRNFEANRFSKQISKD